VGSIPIASFTLWRQQPTQGDRIGVNALIRWEGLGNRHRRGRGLMTSRNPALPLDSHVQSHAEVFKNKLCEFHALLIARAIVGGWTRRCQPSPYGKRHTMVRAIARFHIINPWSRANAMAWVRDQTPSLSKTLEA
jgi:hypothetical protein